TDHVTYLKSYDPRASAAAASYNRRTELTPQLRAVCKTSRAVSEMLGWARQHDVPFSVRSGGHCFEGLSQNRVLVIDVRGLSHVTVDPSSQTISVGAGASLADIYRVAGDHNLALPAGWCQSVGIAGHALGGGIGFLSRAGGLACDTLQSVDLVTADGRQRTASASENADLYWASRGGGGGSFGIVTSFRFKLMTVSKVVRFSTQFQIPPARAVEVLEAWSDWAVTAPDEISSEVSLSNYVNGQMFVYLFGMSLGDETTVRTDLERLRKIANADSAIHTKIETFKTASDAISPPDDYQRGSFKYKSDFIAHDAISGATRGVWTGLVETLGRYPTNAVKVQIQSYGGAIGRVQSDATAFPHRSLDLIGLQYSAEFRKESQIEERLAALSAVEAAMRPHVTGGRYVNYPDIDQPDYGTAYWGQNYARLRRIKTKHDPENVFFHAQSVAPFKGSSP
ncbi:MAG: FAD-binding oxidoreductase, partial [Pseudomonadota bacterium]